MGATAENREGGTLPGFFVPGGVPFPEELETRRIDAGLVSRLLLSGDRLLSVRASAMGQRHAHLFGDTPEDDLHATGFGEVTLSGTDAGHTWVLGAALQREHYDARDVEGFDCTYTTPSLVRAGRVPPRGLAGTVRKRPLRFPQQVRDVLQPPCLRPRAARCRVDGTRLGGYRGLRPDPIHGGNRSRGPLASGPLGRLEAERARNASLDVGRTFGEFELNGTIFGSVVHNALMIRASEQGSLVLFNADEPTRTWGTEMLARWHHEPFHLTATHTYLRSTEVGPEALSSRREVSLTPRHSLGLVGMWEAEDQGRAGVEVYYTGRQALEDNPYRDASRPYLILGFLAERRFGRARAFLNAENLLDVRQTRFDPVLLPARSPEGRWTTDLWAPLEGRVFNAGVRYEF